MLPSSPVAIIKLWLCIALVWLRMSMLLSRATTTSGMSCTWKHRVSAGIKVAVHTNTLAAALCLYNTTFTTCTSRCFHAKGVSVALHISCGLPTIKSNTGWNTYICLTIDSICVSLQMPRLLTVKRHIQRT